MLGGGLLTLLCSVEVCIRLYKAKKRVQDPELDNLINPHEVKHWMDPKLIPYGWGLFKEDEEQILVLDKGEMILFSITPLLAFSLFTASTNYILKDAQPGTSGSQEIVASAANLDSVIDITEDEDAIQGEGN